MSDIYFTNAAIQNRDFSLDDQPGKIAGIRFAHALNALHGNTETSHNWNNVGMFHTAEENSQSQRIFEKYQSESMKAHLDFWGISQEEINTYTDDDSNFGTWAKNLISRLLSTDSLRLEFGAFHHCPQCEISLAPEEAPINSCNTCDNPYLELKEEWALFLYPPEDVTVLLSPDKLYNKLNVRREQDALKQIPPRLLISRDRDIGIVLNDVEDRLGAKVLDPRMGIGLLALFIANELDYETVAMTQSVSTLIRTAPYIGTVAASGLELPRLLYAPHSKIAPEILQNPGTIECEVIAPLASGQRTQDVTAQRLEQASREFGKLQRNHIALHTILKRLDLSEVGIELAKEHDTLGISGGEDFSSLFSQLGKDSGRLIEQLKRVSSVEAQHKAIIAQSISMLALLDRFLVT